MKERQRSKRLRWKPVATILLEGTTNECSTWRSRTVSEPTRAWSNEWKSRRGLNKPSSRLRQLLLSNALYSSRGRKKLPKLSEILSTRGRSKEIGWNKKLRKKLKWWNRFLRILRILNNRRRIRYSSKGQKPNKDKRCSIKSKKDKYKLKRDRIKKGNNIKKGSENSCIKTDKMKSINWLVLENQKKKCFEKQMRLKNSKNLYAKRWLSLNVKTDLRTSTVYLEPTRINRKK